MSAAPSIDDLFEHRTIFPDSDARERLNLLVGLDDQKSRLSKILGLLINPKGLELWVEKYHPSANDVLSNVLRRPPLVVLAGDVGAGKSELASTIGDMIARQEEIDVTLLPLSLSTRGQGRVGEMTQLITTAFDFAIAEATKLKSASGKTRGALILLVDEADAIGQSREEAQMHHEDRAGVNAFIRGIDRLGNGRLPAAVIMCTNRLSALDPAIRRRAADILSFSRPTREQRHAVLKKPLSTLGFSEADIADIVEATGATAASEHGFTFSDITQRLLPGIVLGAYPTGPVNPQRAKDFTQSMVPTAPFKDKTN